MPGKLGRTSKERNALLRNQASQLIWYGKIETTAPKAKELQSYVEKLITKAVNTYDDNVEFEVVKKDKNGKEFLLFVNNSQNKIERIEGEYKGKKIFMWFAPGQMQIVEED